MVPSPSYDPVIGSRGRMIEHKIEHLSGALTDRGIRLLGRGSSPRRAYRC
jgi:hypothetical protein